MDERSLITVMGYALGSEIAVVLSWSVNHSILWATLHGSIGWVYVGYYWLVS